MTDDISEVRKSLRELVLDLRYIIPRTEGAVRPTLSRLADEMLIALEPLDSLSLQSPSVPDAAGSAFTRATVTERQRNRELVEAIIPPSAKRNDLLYAIDHAMSADEWPEPEPPSVPVGEDLDEAAKKLAYDLCGFYSLQCIEVARAALLSTRTQALREMRERAANTAEAATFFHREKWAVETYMPIEACWVAHAIRALPLDPLDKGTQP